MSYSYLIKIDKDHINEKDEILKYIMEQIKQDNMIGKINEIKCITNRDLSDICRKKISCIGKIKKQKQNSTDICSLCNKYFESNQFIFTFNACNHSFHKKCINSQLKKITNQNVCSICKDSYLHNIIDFI
jgi:hypothetical protein